MAVYQGSLTVKRRPKDGMPGSQGTPGSSGSIPIQKEWVVGDTHRFNNEIKDFIYVRGVSSNTSYWYTRTSKGDIVAGAAPVGGANVEGYTRVDWMRNLAVMILLAEEANLANFIFKDEKLISVRGTVDGVETNYSGQANFKPYIIIDGKTGKIYAEGAEISGVINALSGSIGDLSIYSGMLASYDPSIPAIPPGDQIQLSKNEISLRSLSSVPPYMDTETSIKKSLITVKRGPLGGPYSYTEIKPDGIYIDGQKFTGGEGGYTHPSSHSADMISAGTFAGIVKANNNTSYTTKQVRNIILSTNDADSSQMANGDIWIKYAP